MGKQIAIKEMLDDTRKIDTAVGDFTLGCKMPLQYRAATPLFGKRNGKVYVMIPFNYYKVTGVVDQTEVYPIRYTVTFTVPDRKPADFEDLSLNAAFKRIDFSKSAGYFRHESIKELKKAEYKALQTELYGMYDKLIEDLICGKETPAEEVRRFSGLLGRLVPPSLKPQYKALDADFYYTYLD